MGDKAYFAKRRKEKMAAGVCIYCNNKRCKQSKVFCRTCLEKTRQRSRRNQASGYYSNWRAERKRKGLCQCGQPIAEGSSAYCNKCLEKNRARPKGKYKPTALQLRYYRMQARAKRRNQPIMTIQEFTAWYGQQKQRCHYCGITPAQLNSQDKKQQRLTVDRKDNNQGYLLVNICLACFRCNNSKSDFFTEQEWLDIAEKYIRPRLNEYHSS